MPNKSPPPVLPSPIFHAVSGIDELKITLPDNQRIAVPKKAHIPGFYPILMLVGGIFLTLGITSIASMTWYLTSMITSLFSSQTGWNTLVTSLLIGLTGAVVATIVFVSANRGKEVSQRFSQVFSQVVLDDAPKTFFEMSGVPSVHFFYNLKKRGCHVYGDPSGTGIHVHCDKMPITPAMSAMINGKEDDNTPARRLIQIFFFNGVILVLFLLLQDGILVGNTYNWVWFIVMVFFVILMVEIGTFRLWISILVIAAYLILARIFLATIIPADVWVEFLSIWMIYTTVNILVYYLQPNLCTNDAHWFCDRL